MQITILPEQFSGDPQSTAMLQAFYSRSTERITPRLARLGLDLTKVRAALKKFYIGYGHNSIADCGTVTLFVEGVSLLAAKALQEDALYNGQECSTRYIRLTGELYDHNEYADAWMNVQRDVLRLVTDGVRQEHRYEGSLGDESGYAAWMNATAARAFDVARAWIPTPALTNLSVHMTLRKLNEMTARLNGHPISEVRNVVRELRQVLAARYPDACQSFTDQELKYAEWLSRDERLWYCTPQGEPSTMLSAFVNRWQHGPGDDKELFCRFNLMRSDIALLNTRPRHAPVPDHWQNKATFTLRGMMDYGTWRDLQRHRRQTGAPPALTGLYGMNHWYFRELRRYVHEIEAEEIIACTKALFSRVAEGYTRKELDPTYALPLGANVPFEYEFGLSQALYFAELRSGNTVHPILRPFAQAVAQELENCGIRVDYDSEPARFDVRRGRQTITESTT